MLKNVMNSVKSLFQSGEKKEALKKLSEAINKALADNDISPEEYAEIHKLQKDLGVTDEEMADIKIQILDNFIGKINADDTISEEEIKIFYHIREDLGVEYKVELDKEEGITKEDLMKGLNSVKNFLIKVKDTTVNLGGKVVEKTKDILHHDEKKAEEVKKEEQK